nr:retrovirus-related Pol polyprotein from transposon TNT 1-94 [Tanacetum cinerariifolium]
MSNVKESVAERTCHQRQFERRVNKRQMQTLETKIDTGKALDVDLVVTESSMTESEVQDESNKSGNDTDVNDTNIRPIYNEEPMADVQLTAECNIFAIGQQHTEQPKIITEGKHGKFLNGKSNEAKIKHDTYETETINIELEHCVAKLLSKNELLHKENKHLKQTDKDLYDSIKRTQVHIKVHNDSLIVKLNDKSTENADLKAQLQEKNVKEAMFDPAWIESMQEELLQFKRLDVWVLVLALDNNKPLTLKWLFKNKHDEENTIIQNKSHLVVRGYRQEEGIDFEESFAPDSGFELTGFSDADDTGCKDTFKSTSGGAQFLGENLVSWSSKKQDCTALSTAKAEYVSLSACCAQVLWMRTQLRDYGFHFNKLPIYCDSKSAIAIAISCNPVQYSRTKYIIVRYHFIKEHVEKAKSRFKTSCSIVKDKYMMKAQAHVSKSSAISDVQALPQKEHYRQDCRTISKLNLTSRTRNTPSIMWHKQISRHRFSPNKSSTAYEKISPRSDLRWKPTSRILKFVGLRWIPTGKLFESCTSKVDNKPPHGFNGDISRIHVCKQTMDFSAEVQASLLNVKEVLTSDIIVTMSMIELESIFGPLFGGYLNGENQVVSNSSAITTADASDKRQQQEDSTSSTSTLDTTTTADGNFD